MTFNDTQIPSNCKFTPNMDIKTWKPGVALMLTAWQTRIDPLQSFNDAIDEQPGWVDAIEEEYIAEEEYKDWAGKLVKDCITDYCDSSWVAVGKTMPKDFEVWQITWDDNANTFNCCDIQIVVDANTKEILLAMTRSD
jgi:hypothetical protein